MIDIKTHILWAKGYVNGTLSEKEKIQLAILLQDASFKIQFDQEVIAYQLILFRDIQETTEILQGMSIPKSQNTWKWIRGLGFSLLTFGIIFFIQKGAPKEKESLTQETLLKDTTEIVTNAPFIIVKDSTPSLVDIKKPDKSNAAKDSLNETDVHVNDSIQEVIVVLDSVTESTSKDTVQKQIDDLPVAKEEDKVNCENSSIEPTYSETICFGTDERGYIAWSSEQEISHVFFNNEKHIGTTSFDDLNEGQYDLIIYFSNRCIDTLDFTIKKINCLDKKPIINANLNKFWKILLSDKAKLTILNRSGQIQEVLLLEADEEYVYTGSQLQKGLFTYILELENGEKYFGSLRVY